MRVAVDEWVVEDGWNMDGRRAFGWLIARTTIWEQMDKIVGDIYELVSSVVRTINLSRSQDIAVYHQE